MILQHPLFDKLLATRERLPDRFQEDQYRLGPADLPTDDNATVMKNYRDPLSADPEGRAYDRHWLARIEPVKVRDKDVGWQVIVQQAYESAIGATLAELRSKLVSYGLAALAMVALVLVSLWGLAFRLLGETAPLKGAALPGPATEGSSRLPLTPRGPTETQRGAGGPNVEKPASDKRS
jgi:hypothetical protein